ncbi:hypothetical protein TK90_2333 [Thioalkalivibrio sp. K90mix]|jgi:myosin-crossreactive antigen|uniref:hypothetical protein n=1 Tax=unclassified Thioalkalivibrio TaxID=2621013 RepID=UPI00019598AE|nr:MULTISPECIES: hypothetical protein [unclassified Thioalkalivibrio]ADC72823.1 hypothetical protein TK90_2333 [Thioalkalivibrio sp. K90mix]
MRKQTGIAGLLLAVMLVAGAVVQADEPHTVEQLNQAPSELEGEQVRLEGIVGRVQEDIMGRNFIHFVDGTGHEGDYITITSTELPEVGDRVSVTGTLILDRDFGAGYTYPVIIEDAAFSKE